MELDPIQDLHVAIGATRSRFLATVTELRPRLHRFCARMTGSPLDGEDMVQETLAQAFYSLASLNDGARLERWLFRIAHNKCVDFLRRPDKLRTESVPLEEELLTADSASETQVDDAPIDEALVALVTALPPMERACVLLKDVLDYSLADTAGVVDSTVGAVKAALHRGRSKLRGTKPQQTRAVLPEDRRRLLEEYVSCFNARDWESLQRLIRADARVEIVSGYETVATTYVNRYGTLPWEWRFSVADVAGEVVLVHWRRSGEEWIPSTAVRMWWRDGKVARIRDYVHSEYLFDHSRGEIMELPPVAPAAPIPSPT